MKYYALKCTVDTDEFAEECYGVLLLDDDGNREYICNVSYNYEKVCDLVNEMNVHKVESYQAREIIEDFCTG